MEYINIFHLINTIDCNRLLTYNLIKSSDFKQILDFSFITVNNFYPQNIPNLNIFQQIILLITSSHMGNCENHCMNQKQDKDIAYSMLLFPNNTISSISNRDKQLLSTQESFEQQQQYNGNYHMQMAIVYYNSGQYQYSINQFTLALIPLCKNSSTFAFVHFHIAKSYLALQKNKFAFEHCKIALEKYRMLQNHQLMAACAQLLGQIKILQGDSILGVYYYEKALQIYSEVTLDRKMKMEILYTLGVIQMDLQDYDKVLSYFRELELCLLNEYPNDKKIIIYLYLGKVYCMKNNFEKAIAYINRCFTMILPASQQYQQMVTEFMRMLERIRQDCPKKDYPHIFNTIRQYPFLTKLIDY